MNKLLRGVCLILTGMSAAFVVKDFAVLPMVILAGMFLKWEEL